MYHYQLPFIYDEKGYTISRFVFSGPLIIYQADYIFKTLGIPDIKCIIESDNVMKMKKGSMFLSLQIKHLANMDAILHDYNITRCFTNITYQ